MSLIYPVIHHINERTTLSEVELACVNGADGVFLISHRGEDAQVLEVAKLAKHALPGFKIGINLLTESPVFSCHAAAANGLDMVWADDVGVTSRGYNDMARSLSRFANTVTSVQLFGSVAFKYQDAEPKPKIAAQLALGLGFIPTTSGNATGSPPSVSKITSMSHATHGVLAVASGITPHNVGLFAPYLSHILVSTGISRDEHHINPVLLKALINHARLNDCHNAHLRREA